ncbi:MAG: hypothetical protein LUD69_05800 [Oscillospiraceae bacterium]|nr:hypothetical protein [Oscillospiraceae bacterium]
MKQKLIGVLILAVCVGVLVFAAHGTGFTDSDATPVLLLAPLGLWLTVSKRRIIC